MMESPPPSRSPARTAAAVSLVVHAAAVLVLWMIPDRPYAAPEPERNPIEVVLQGAERREPTFFTELPEDRADEPPEDPQFLSNVDSRARDEAPGGDESLPQSDGEAESPQVEMVKADPARESAPPVPEPSTAPRSEARPSLAEADGGSPAAPPESASPPPSPPDPQVSVRTLAGMDIRQQGMRNPGGNTGLTGDITLSTTAWEYAPWLQVFRRAVTERWLPPAAYRMGLIDGWVLAHVEIARDGSLVRVDVLDQDVGNPALTDAVVYALTAPAPYHKLPSDFPDPALGLTIRFVYPSLKGR
jgi:hypothetical protein